MKINKISTILALVFCIPAFANQPTTLAGDKPAMIYNQMSVNGGSESIIDDLLDKMKGAIKDKITGGVKSFLINALFGSGGPKYVNLSEESLRQIENIVNKSILTANTNEALALLDALDTTLEFYNASVSNGSAYSNVLDELIVDANKLEKYYVFNKSKNTEYYFLTKSYIIISTLTMSIYTEMYLQDVINKEFLQNKGKYFAARLEDMRNDTISYVYRNTRLLDAPDDGYLSIMTFVDNIANRRFDMEYYTSEDQDELYDFLASEQKMYIDNISSGVDGAIFKLNHITE